MIIIPELKKVLILTPRSGSTSLKDAVLAKYPNAMMIYRHMEADGIPHGYDRWDKLGVVRHPLERLWSLYKYMENFNGDYLKEYIKRLNNCVKDISFNDWIIKNETTFTSPYSDNGTFYPKYMVNHALPENRKSQFLYLRPDLGTKIFRFDRIQEITKELNVKLKKSNSSNDRPMPEITSEVHKHVNKYLLWYLQQYQ